MGASSRTTNLQLPLYTNPAADTFDLTEWNNANSSIENMYTEVINARDGEVNLLTKINNIDTSLADSMTKLEDIAINIKKFGATCDGTTNDITPFVNACSYCVANNKALFIPSATKIVMTGDITVPSFVGNSKSKLIVDGNYNFVITDNLVIKDITVQRENNYNVFKSTSLVSNVWFQNVNAIYNTATLDGSVHAGTVIKLDGGVNNLVVKNLTTSNFATAISTSAQSTGIAIDDITINNFVTGIYLHGYAPKLPDGTWVDQVYINNAKFINTSQQQTTMLAAGSVAGKDGMLLEYVSNVVIRNVVCRYPGERVLYCSYGKNVVMENFKLINAGAIKFVGDNRKNVGAVYGTPVNNNISDGCWISKITSENSLVDNSCFEFYNARNIYVSDVYYDGGNVANVFMYTKELVENLNMTRCTAKNIKRSFWVFWDDINGIPGVNDGINQIDAKPPADYDAWTKGARFTNLTIENVGQIGYCAFRADDTTTPSAGTYKFQDFVLENIDAYVTDDELYDDNSAKYFKGLVDINHAKDWFMENNHVHGFKMNEGAGITSILPFKIGSNTSNIILRHKHTYRLSQTSNFFLGTLYLSCGSEIELLGSARGMGMFKKTFLTVKAPDGTGIANERTVDMNSQSIIDIEATVNSTYLVDGTIFGDKTNGSTFPMPSNIYGYIQIFDSAGNFGNYQLKSDGTMILRAGSDSIFSAIADNTKISVYKSGTAPAIIFKTISSPSQTPASLCIKARLQTSL